MSPRRDEWSGFVKKRKHLSFPALAVRQQREREGKPWTPIPSPCVRTASAFTKVTVDQVLTLTRRSFSEGGRRG